ncbi:receptor like protein kinase S.2 [Helianthus annuus]|uniref:receptor like protein kinase S.2 n=1 Tax=Helianthus annuus TaxID=4232 RepID=UPI001652D00B|nr:receptor like protein kinase S.2 [Helianthus annuus]
MNEVQQNVICQGNIWKHLKIRLSDIQLATQNFSKTYEIGPLEDYPSYRVELDYFDKENHSSVEEKIEGEYPQRRNSVIVRRYPFGEDSYKEKYFFREIEVLTSVKHPNIVTLYGFCIEGLEMILVTENVANGYLGDYLGKVNDMHILTWEKRLKICIDVAHALNHLHYEMKDQKKIINRDIRSPNIGLDENLGAKIYNFRFSLFFPTNQNDTALYPKKLAGYIDYIDPEYRKTRKLKRESDVYGFGVFLFEILCGRRATDPIYKTESDKGLAHIARRNFSIGKLEDMIDPLLKEKTHENSSVLNKGPNKDSLNTFIEIAHQCVEKTQNHRPTMKVVVKELEKALFLQRQMTTPAGTTETVTMEGMRSKGRTKLTWDELPMTELIMDQLIWDERMWDENLTAHDVIDFFHHNDMPELRRRNIKAEKLEYLSQKLEHLKICLSDIKLATDNFSEACKIASLNGLTLYRAEVDHFDIENHPSIEGKNAGDHPKIHNTIVITRYPYGPDTDGEEFFTQIEMLSSVKHPNIVTLLGYCVEGFEMIIVTENVSNGYLSDYLEKVNSMHILTWEKRLKICIDVAHALRYIHYEMENQKAILNCDISSYNIGLDENLKAKISNFGFSVFISPNQEALYSNRSFGNIYYIDPEYEKTGMLKRESDVYSFGVVLFEILCGRMAGDQIYKESDKRLAPLARQRFCMGTLEDMIDPILKDEIGENNFVLNGGPNKDSLHTYIEIAHKCVAETQDQRPTMEVVIRELEKAIFIQVSLCS